MEIPKPPIWNLFCPSLGTEKWGSGGEETSSPPYLQKREVGVPGAGFFPPPALSAPYELAYASPFTNYSGVGSGGTSNWGRGRSPLPRFGPRTPFETHFAEFLTEFRLFSSNCVAKNPGGEVRIPSKGANTIDRQAGSPELSMKEKLNYRRRISVCAKAGLHQGRDRTMQ